MHTPCMNRLEVLEDALIEVDHLGAIASITQPAETDYRQKLEAAQNSKALIDTLANQLIIPSLVDLHLSLIHI